MQNIQVRRYRDPETRKVWQGYLGPEDGSWVLFIPGEESGKLYLHIADEVPERPEPEHILCHDCGKPMQLAHFDFKHAEIDLRKLPEFVGSDWCYICTHC